jgi:peptidyl-prolyl cis-trans isomerase C
MFPITVRRSLPAILALLLSVPAPMAQETTAPAAPDPKAVVATVGDDVITEADIGFAAEDLGDELQNVPPEQRKAFLLTVLIDMKVMAVAAREANMQATDEYQQRLGYLEDRALRRAYFSEKVAAEVTEEAVKAAYDAFVAGFTPEDEIHARHILVATEADALAIKAEIDAGASFEQLASEKSMDPSGTQNGGDLGFFTRGMMVKPFEDAAFALQPGQVSAPIQTQFGWHLIKLEETRKSAPPTLAQVAPQIQQDILFSTFDRIVGELKEKSPVEISDPVLAAQVKQQSEPVATE